MGKINNIYFYFVNYSINEILIFLFSSINISFELKPLIEL